MCENPTTPTVYYILIWEKELHLKLSFTHRLLFDAKIYLINQKHDISQEMSCSNMDYSHVRHQHGAVSLTCMSFNTRMIMMVGGVGGLDGWRGQRGCDLWKGLYQVVAGYLKWTLIMAF